MYLEKPRDKKISLVDINSRISCIQIDMDKIYTYMKNLAMHTVSPLLLFYYILSCRELFIIS